MLLSCWCGVCFVTRVCITVEGLVHSSFLCPGSAVYCCNLCGLSANVAYMTVFTVISAKILQCHKNGTCAIFGMGLVLLFVSMLI